MGILLYYNLPKAKFYLLKGGYTPQTAALAFWRARQSRSTSFLEASDLASTCKSTTMWVVLKIMSRYWFSTIFTAPDIEGCQNGTLISGTTHVLCASRHHRGELQLSTNLTTLFCVHTPSVQKPKLVLSPRCAGNRAEYRGSSWHRSVKQSVGAGVLEKTKQPERDKHLQHQQNWSSAPVSKHSHQRPRQHNSRRSHTKE